MHVCERNSNTYLEALRKTHQSPGQDLNNVPLKHKVEMLLTTSQHQVTSLRARDTEMQKSQDCGT
jgi:hypothetical protein